LQFSFDRRSSNAEENQAAAGGDEKLRKAIERNRAKMAKRQMRASGSAPSGAAPQKAAAPQRSLADKLRSSGMPGMPGKKAPESVAAPGRSARAPRPTRPARQAGAEQSASQSLIDKMRARRGGASEMPPKAPAPKAAPSTRRRQVTDPNKIEMAEPIRSRTTAPATVAYSDTTAVKAPSRTAVKAKRTVKTKSKKGGGLAAWAVKGTWAFCAFLLLRLIFSEGGVIEYYDKKSALDQKSYELETLKNENVSLMEELELIRSNSRYQKKLVRDHLGYIARDEYLILFPESSKKSRRRGLTSI
jgi:cell division protein FtsB